MNVTAPFTVRHLLSIVLAHLGRHTVGHSAVLLHDSASVDFMSTIVQHIATHSQPSRHAWRLLQWPQLTQPGVERFFGDTPLVIVAVCQSPQLVVEQLTAAFDWRRLNNQSRHLVFVEHPAAEEAYDTERFVEQSARDGRLVTVVVWHGATHWRLFRRPRDEMPPTLDYYLMYDPPHAFRTVGWPVESELGSGESEAKSATPSTTAIGFGGSEVWLVEMIAAALNRTVNFYVYDYASFQPDDCFDCRFYETHYTRPHRMADVRPPNGGAAIDVTSTNSRWLRKASHRRGPVVYTGLSYLVLDDLDVVAQRLYPYAYENYRIVVPADAPQSGAVWGNRSQSQLLAASCGLMVVFVCVRLAVSATAVDAEGAAGSRWALCLETLGVALGATTARLPRGGAEQLWLGTLAVFALIVSITCSGVLFQRLAMPLEPTAIRTLQELVDDGRYNLMVPFSESLPPGLSEAFRRKNLDIYTCNVAFMLEMIWMRKPNFAYILPESKLSIFNAPHLWHNNRCVYRVLEEIFYGRYACLKISPWFLRSLAERTIQLANDHGQFVHFQRWSSVVSELSGVMHSTVRYRPTHDRPLWSDVSYVTFDDLSFVFNVYLIGNGLATVVFAIEWWLKHVRVSVRMVAVSRGVVVSMA